MRTRLVLIPALALVAVFIASAQAYTESGSVAEPWAGWWWPRYHVEPPAQCPYCPHLWQGPNIEGPPGPIYDLDTRYFWRQGPARTLAQEWEYAMHRTTNPKLRWTGHCNGVSCAQALEPDPPTDCGALSQDDLEGLLAEIYLDCAGYRWAGPFAKPSDMWLALRKCLEVRPETGGLGHATPS